MTEYQKIMLNALLGYGWPHSEALRIVQSDYVYRCVMQGDGPEKAAKDMNDRYPKGGV